MDYIFYFAITIGILVFVHEFGHFAAAKLSKMRVDVFAIGFGKRLFGWNKLNGFSFGELPKDWDGQGHTDYRLSLLPLGGYVKIAGMVDESFDTEFADKEPQPYEFRAKGTLAKMFVITAGVMMNLTLTWVIFWGINFFQGKEVIKTTQIGYVAEGSLASDAGFKTNDKIISIDGDVVANWEETLNKLLVDNIGKKVTVLINRQGQEASVVVDTRTVSDAAQNEIFITPAFTQPYIQDVMKNSPAEDAGVETGDIMLSLNNITLTSIKQTSLIIQENKDKDLPLVLLRGTDTIRTSVNPGEEGMIGIQFTDVYSGPVDYQSYGFFASIAKGGEDIVNYTFLTFSMLKNVISGDVEFGKAFGGPVKIAQFAAKSAESGMSPFLRFLAMLSLSLAIINILPFPVLDGGHVVIIAIEGIIRRELPIKVKIAIQNAGFVVLLLLMAFIIYSDIMSL